MLCWAPAVYLWLQDEGSERAMFAESSIGMNGDFMTMEARESFKYRKGMLIH
jgi:hypothetical protein